MKHPRLSYAAVTPARDEAQNLRRLATSMLAQDLRPRTWVVVDNGSTDETRDVAAELAAREPWIRVVHAPNDATRPGAPVVRAFAAGLDVLDDDDDVDVVVKLDADVTFDAAYFAELVACFERDPALGIASGVCWEHDGEEWLPTHVTGDHVRGATRAYRRACLDEIGPLPEAMGWDGVDELKAAVRGWRTRSIAELRFFHHRPVGARDGTRARRWLEEGRCAHYMGYRVPYLLARTVGRALRDRQIAPFAMPWAFAVAAMRRTPRYPDPEVRAYLRRQQGLRHLPLRLRESFGRR